MRFDEMELDGLPPIVEESAIDDATDDAPRFRRILALLTDLSLFAALTLALLPLLPPSRDALAIASLAGFVIIVSYYYFVGSWLLWGKTIGGAIFDVRVVSDAMTPKTATMRWLGMFASMLTAGIGFLIAALPSRLSLADRLSSTRCVAG
jgi:uncharacterized RDD family membrane protein YckC